MAEVSPNRGNPIVNLLSQIKSLIFIKLNELICSIGINNSKTNDLINSLLELSKKDSFQNIVCLKSGVKLIQYSLFDKTTNIINTYYYNLDNTIYEDQSSVNLSTLGDCNSNESTVSVSNNVCVNNKQWTKITVFNIVNNSVVNVIWQNELGELEQQPILSDINNCVNCSQSQEEIPVILLDTFNNELTVLEEYNQ